MIRTVHHVDDFTSPSLIACQDRSIVAPDSVLCVSRPWVERLAAEFGVAAGLVHNGVDARRFRPARDDAERGAARRVAGLGERLAVLTVGGIEPRKGSLCLLEGFAALRDLLPERDPVLLIAGGTTLFDYRHELERFSARATELGVTGHVRVLGALEPAEIERLYRAADVFAFPSVKEGFGLAALEALAADLPWSRPTWTSSAASSPTAATRCWRRSATRARWRAMARVARDELLRARLRAGGREVVRAFTWDGSAAAHERVYGARPRRGARRDERGARGHGDVARRVRRGVTARGHEIAVDEPRRPAATTTA